MLKNDIGTLFQYTKPFEFLSVKVSLKWHLQIYSSLQYHVLKLIQNKTKNMVNGM